LGRGFQIEERVFVMYPLVYIELDQMPELGIGICLKSGEGDAVGIDGGDTVIAFRWAFAIDSLFVATAPAQVFICPQAIANLAFIVTAGTTVFIDQMQHTPSGVGGRFRLYSEFEINFATCS
jgi:hypothetical protein